MPTFRCEFAIIGDLVLPPDLPELVLKGSGDLTVTFKNDPINKEGHPVGLLAIVIGTATTLADAHDELGRGLAEQLDLLAFATHSRFTIVKPLRVFEWDAGQARRKFRIFHKSDARDPPEPLLEAPYLDTVVALGKASPPAFARTALKYFRYGLLDDQPQDQFMRLWLALEVVAENLKEKERVPIVCSVCGANAKCGACGDEPTRIPMAKQAIDQLISLSTGKRAAEISKMLFTARNGLMHGRTREAIEADCKEPMNAIVDELGRITWNAIMSTIPLKNDWRSLAFGYRGGEFANMTLIVAMLGSFDHKGDAPHPAEDALPNAKITLGFEQRPKSLFGLGAEGKQQ